MESKFSIALCVILVGLLFISIGCMGGGEEKPTPATDTGMTTDTGGDTTDDGGDVDTGDDGATDGSTYSDIEKEIAHISKGTVEKSENWPEYQPGEGMEMKDDGAIDGPDDTAPIYGEYEKVTINEAFRSISTDIGITEEPVSGSETYEDYGINKFYDTSKDPYSTFSIDVDTGSYTLCRSKIFGGALPHQDSVRVEEFVNYFKPVYPQPEGDEMFYVSMEGAPSPFNEETYLLRIGLQGKEVDPATRPPVNLVFLIDVSGSMNPADKLGLVKESLSILVENLGQMDSIAICTYAGRVAEILPPTGVEDKETILNALNSLQSGGSTAMASGIDLAYDLASKNFMQEGINRVIICSDGDANVGQTSHEKILEQIKTQTEQGVTLSTLGFGSGNYNDTMMEQLADNGNGNYYYIDSQKEAERIFTQNLLGTLQVIAKDVKIQVEFNPEKVKEYRLIGYENRDIADQEFRDDTKDAGEVGAGHSVTALYEVVLTDSKKDLGLVQLRYKLPDHETANEYHYPFKSDYIYKTFSEADKNFRFMIAVGEFAEILRGSEYAKGSLEDVLQIAQSAYNKNDEDEMEFVDLIKKCIKYKK